MTVQMLTLGNAADTGTYTDILYVVVGLTGHGLGLRVHPLGQLHMSSKFWPGKGRHVLPNSPHTSWVKFTYISSGMEEGQYLLLCVTFHIKV